MKLKAGDIFRHKDGTLYMCSVDEDNIHDLRFVNDLQKGQTYDSPKYLLGVLNGEFDTYLTHTGINICDLIKKVNDET